MAFNPYPNLSGQINLVAPNRSVTTPGRRPLADVSVVGEAYRNFGQVISNLGGQAAELALRAKLDDERLAHDEASLAFASGLNRHEMDMRNNPQKYANMKYEDMQSNYMGQFGPDGTLISTIIKPYEDKPELQRSIKNTLTQMGLSSASTAFRVHSTYREKQIETEVNSNLEDKRTQAFLLAQQQNPDLKAIEKIETDFLNSLEPYKTLTDPRKEFYKNKLYESMADGALISHKLRNPNPSDYLKFLNSEKGQGIVKIASFSSVYQAYTGALQGVTDRDKAQAESAQRALFISTLQHNPSAIIENVEKDKVVIKQKERTAQNSKKNEPMLFHLLPDDWIASKIASWRNSVSKTGFDPDVKQQFRDLLDLTVQTFTQAVEEFVEAPNPEIAIERAKVLESLDFEQIPVLRKDEGNPFFSNGKWLGDENSYKQALGLQAYIAWLVPHIKTLYNNPTKSEIREILTQIDSDQNGIWTRPLKDILTSSNGLKIKESIRGFAKKRLLDFNDPNKKFEETAKFNTPSGNYSNPQDWEPGNYHQVFKEMARLMPNTDLSSLEIMSPEKLKESIRIIESGNSDEIKHLVTTQIPNHYGQTYMPQVLRQLLRNPATRSLGALIELGQGMDSNSYMQFTRMTPDDWVTIAQALRIEKTQPKLNYGNFLQSALRMQSYQGLHGVDDLGEKAGIHTEFLARLAHAKSIKEGITGTPSQIADTAVGLVFQDIYKDNYLMVKHSDESSAGNRSTVVLLRDQTDRILDKNYTDGVNQARSAITAMEQRLRDDISVNPQNYTVRFLDGTFGDGERINKEFQRTLKIPGGSVDLVFRNLTRNNVQGIGATIMARGPEGYSGKVIGFIYKGQEEDDQSGTTFFSGDELDTLLAMPIYEDIVEDFDESATVKYMGDNILGIGVDLNWLWFADDYPMSIKDPEKHQMFQLMHEKTNIWQDPVKRKQIIDRYTTSIRSQARSSKGQDYWWRAYGKAFGTDQLFEYLAYKEYQKRVYDYMEDNGLRVTVNDYDKGGHEFIQMVLPDDDWEMNGKPMKGMKTLANEYEKYLEQGNYGFLNKALAGILDSSQQNVTQALWDLYGTLSLGFDPNNVKILPYEARGEAKIKKYFHPSISDFFMHMKSGDAFKKMGAHFMHFKGELTNATPNRTGKTALSKKFTPKHRKD